MVSASVSGAKPARYWRSRSRQVNRRQRDGVRFSLGISVSGKRSGARCADRKSESSKLSNWMVLVDACDNKLTAESSERHLLWTAYGVAFA